MILNGTNGGGSHYNNVQHQVNCDPNVVFFARIKQTFTITEIFSRDILPPLTHAHTHTYWHPTVHHTSKQHHRSSLQPLVSLSINATQVSEKRVKQQAVTALAPGCLNHLPVSWQRLSGTSSTSPCSCTGCPHCENLLSASSAEERVLKYPDWLHDDAADSWCKENLSVWTCRTNTFSIMSQQSVWYDLPLWYTSYLYSFLLNTFYSMYRFFGITATYIFTSCIIILL